MNLWVVVKLEFFNFCTRLLDGGCRRRLTQEMLIHMSGRISGGFQAVRLHYLPALRQHILNVLKKYVYPHKGMPLLVSSIEEGTTKLAPVL